MTSRPTIPYQASTFVDASRDLLGDGLLGVYLHGSIATRELQPQSDLDLLLVTATPLSARNKAEFLVKLMALSAVHATGPGAPRCLDVLAVHADDLTAPTYPGRSEFIYGEWLRAGFERGDALVPVIDPVVTLILAQAYHEARAIYGPPLSRLMSPIERQVVDRALLDSLQPLLDNLIGDERNVLLTLARMWRTSVEGDFVGKDVAAEWAGDRSPLPVAEVLRKCGRAYRGEYSENWQGDHALALTAASYLREELLKNLAADPEMNTWTGPAL